MNPNVTINGIEYTPIGGGDEVRIVIGQRGWVWVGWWSQDGTQVTLTKARCIRKWGTTSGLGELVGGPLPSTILDPTGTVRLHELAVVASYAADSGAWRGHLS